MRTLRAVNYQLGARAPGEPPVQIKKYMTITEQKMRLNNSQSFYEITQLMADRLS
jgi:hypothetical protein